MRLLRPLIAVTLLASTLALAQAVPTQVSFTGRVVDSGAPVNGSRDFVFKLFPTVMLGTEVWSETRNAIPVVDGAVNVALGASTPLTDAIFDGQTLYLEVTIGTTVLTPRTPVVSVPYALRAGVAGQVGSFTAAQLQRRVSTGCGIGAAIQTINADGTVVCQAAGAANDAGITTITSITAGAGLTGGGATGNVTLTAAFAGSGTAATISRSDHNHTNTYLPLGTALTCTGTGTDKVVGLASNGSVICGADSNNTYAALANGGLVLSTGNQFSLLPCTPNQVLVAGASGWACAAAPGVLSVGANAPLSVTTGANPVLSLGTVPIANGGTGATTALNARAALGAAASGANSDITALTGLSTPLSAGQGGTGLTTSGASGQFLKSNGAGGWTSAAIAVAEVPAGSGNYVQNQSAAAQAASMFVSGTVRTSGMTREGSEAGTGEPPRVDGFAGGFNGLISRRINSTTIALGSVVARTDMLTLERAGTIAGFRLVKTGTGNLRQTLVCQGVTGAGSPLNKVIDVAAGIATGTPFSVYTDADDAVMMSCVFGGMDTSINAIGHHTTVTIARTNTGLIWFGTLTSTYNQ